MTVTEMHFDFKIKIDKVDSLSREDFSVAHIDWLLNEAQEVFIKQRYGTNNNHRTAFEVSQKRIDDLANLHVKFPLQPVIVPTLTNGVYEVPLSSLAFEYLFFTRGRVTVVDATCGDQVVSLRQIQNDDLNYALTDDFLKSSRIDGVLFNFGKSSTGTGSSIYMYPDTLTLGDVFIEYIKQPNQINFGGYTYIDGTTPALTNCELADHTHREIVDLAVDIAAGIIEHPTYVQLKERKVFKHE